MTDPAPEQPAPRDQTACYYPAPARGLVCDRHYGHPDDCRARVETARGAFIITWRPAIEAPSRIP